MADLKRSALLEQDIVRVLKSSRNTRPGPAALLVSGLAIACLQPDTVFALGLGELQVKSQLGQPLVSTTTARLEKGETLSKDCIKSVGRPDGKLGDPQDLKIVVPKANKAGDYTVQITSRTPLYEPMYEIRIQMRCGGGTTFIRDYVVMLNLPMTSPQTPLVTNQGQPEQLPVQTATQSGPVETAENSITEPEETTVTTESTVTNESTVAGDVVTIEQTTIAQATDLRLFTERFPTPDTPIESGQEYRVMAGDMLSSIAQRITGRPEGSAKAVAEQIFILNPDAFISNDPDRIKLGSLLQIPAATELVADSRQLAGRNEPETTTESSLAEATPELNATDALELTAAAEIDTPIANTPETPAEIITQSEAPETTETEAPETTESTMESAAEPAALMTVPAAPAPSAELIGTDAAEPEIIVDISEPLEPVYEIDSAELEATSAQILEPAASNINETETLAEPTSTSETGSSSNLLVMLGALAAFLIALIVAARRYADGLLAPLFAVLRRDKTEADAKAGVSNAERELGITLGDQSIGGSQQEEESYTVIEEAPATKLESPDITTDMDIEVVEENPQQEGETIDFDLSEGDGKTDELAQTGTFKVDLADIMDEADTTPPLDGPANNGAPAGDGMRHLNEKLEDTNTLQKLFSSEAEELLENVSQSADDSDKWRQDNEGTSGEPPATFEADSLQSIADNADFNDPDDELSITLSKALDVLEQDYEDELTSSQILEQEKIKQHIDQPEEFDEEV